MIMVCSLASSQCASSDLSDEINVLKKKASAEEENRQDLKKEITTLTQRLTDSETSNEQDQQDLKNKIIVLKEQLTNSETNNEKNRQNLGNKIKALQEASLSLATLLEKLRDHNFCNPSLKPETMECFHNCIGTLNGLKEMPIPESVQTDSSPSTLNNADQAESPLSNNIPPSS